MSQFYTLKENKTDTAFLRKNVKNRQGKNSTNSNTFGELIVILKLWSVIADAKINWFTGLHYPSVITSSDVLIFYIVKSRWSKANF